MSDSFCILPFIHAVYNPYDSAKQNANLSVCCRFDQLKNETNQYSNPISESPLWNRLQKQFLDGKKPTECSRCWRDESLGLESYRMNMNAAYNDLIETGEYVSKKLRFLEIVPGNVCNLACRSCSSDYSSKWRPIDTHLISDGLQVFVSEERKFPNWRTLDLTELISLKLMGGEPMYQKDNLELMRYLDQLGRLENLHLHLITNATINISEDWMYFLEKCSYVHLTVSIDAIGDLNDYIRAGSDWKSLEANLYDLLKLREENSHIYLHVNTVVTLLNVNRTKQIEKYFLDLNVPQTQDATAYPYYLDISKLPISIKQKLVELDCVSETVKKVLLSGNENVSIIDQFYKYTKSLDVYHNKNFSKYNSQLHQIYSDYLNEI